MPSLFSDLFNSSGTVGPGQGALTEELGLDQQRRTVSHTRLRRKVARMTVGTVAGIGDECRMMQFKSADRIWDVTVFSDGGATAGAADIGLYESGIAHDGAVVDVDLFASADAFPSVATARVDKFTEATTLGDVDRGKKLWEIAAVGAATYTTDPFLDFDLVATITTALTVAVAVFYIEVNYTAGD